jgi:hypothetical protein
MKTLTQSKTGSFHYRSTLTALLALAPLFTACALEPDPGDLAADPSSDVATDPAKPTEQTATVQSALNTWVLTLNASASTLWPTQQLTLTMTANADVGPTPLYMTIWVSQPGVPAVLLKRCNSGTVCSVTTTSQTPAFLNYVAELTDNLDQQSVENSLIAKVAEVSWKDSQLTLTASPTTLAVGATTTLIAHTVEIGPSASYAEIFDETTGTMIATCGTGTACTATVSQAAATTHAYRAYFSQLSSVSPPPGVVQQTDVQYVTWSASGYAISLSARFDHVTATSSIDVGPTPYYIQIFDLTTGARLAVCSSGTVCSADDNAPVGGPHGVAAFISSIDPTLTPANIQAVSNTVEASGEQH